MSVDKDFVPYQEALVLKELGFNEPCFGYYNSGVKNPLEVEYSIPYDHKEYLSAPLYQQAFRWFREKYNLRGFIGFRPNVKQFDHHIYDMLLSGIEYTKQRTMAEFNKDPLVGTYEEAELACLRKLIEIVKKMR
jgi:hypothetical protein